MTILAVENASFAVGHVPLLDKTSFQLNQGEKVGLIGPNAAGQIIVFENFGRHTKIRRWSNHRAKRLKNRVCAARERV